MPRIKKQQVESDASPIDSHIGKRIKTRRQQKDLSQDDLAKMVGIPYQQLQRYESAATRVAAAMLYEISAALNTPISYFLENAPLELKRIGFSEEGQQPLEPDSYETAIIEENEKNNLFFHYSRIKSKEKRKALYELIRMTAEENEK